MNKISLHIHTQSLLAIIPVFLVLAIGINLLICFLVYRETLWGLREEAMAITLSASSMIDKNGFEKFAKGEMKDSEKQEFLNPIQKILQQQRAVRVFGFTPQKIELFSLTGSSSDKAKKAPISQIPFHYKDEKTNLIKNMTDHYWMIAVAPVQSDSGTLLGYLGIQTNAKILQHRLTTCIRGSIYKIVVALCVGIICAVLIARNLKKKILLLHRAATHIERSQYDIYILGNTGIIREINDLANSFKTMISILKDTVSKGKRRLTEFSQHNQQADMIDRICMPDKKELLFRNTAVYLQPIGKTGTNNFADLYADNHNLICFFGRSAEDNQMENTLKISAFKQYLRKLLIANSAEKIISEACLMFQILDLTILQYKEDMENFLVSHYNQNKMNQYIQPVPENIPVVLHNLGEEANNRFWLYCREFCMRDPGFVIQGLVQLAQKLRKYPSGMLVLLVNTTMIHYISKKENK